MARAHEHRIHLTISPGADRYGVAMTIIHEVAHFLEPGRPREVHKTEFWAAVVLLVELRHGLSVPDMPWTIGEKGRVLVDAMREAGVLDERRDRR
jgi:hypothetical protein